MKKVLLSLGVLAAVLMTVPARDLSSESSPSNETTGGRFVSEWDDYLSVTGWTSLPGNVLFLQFAGPEEDGDTQQFQSGTGYHLNDWYFGGFLGLTLPRTTAANEESDGTTSQLFYDGTTGQVTGVQENTVSNIDENRLQEIDFEIITGLQIGGMDVGISNYLNRSRNDRTGTIRPDDPVSEAFLVTDFTEANLFNVDLGQMTASTPVYPVGFTTGQTSSRTIVRDASGSVTYQNVDVYDTDGYKNSSSLYERFSAGVALSPAMFDVTAELDLGFLVVNSDGAAGRTQYETFYTANFADYAGVPHVQSYSRESAEELSSFLRLDPGLDVNASLDLSELLTVEFGLEYALQAVLADPASYSYRNLAYSAAVDAVDTRYVTTTTTDEVFSVTDDWGFSSHTIGVPVAVTVTPSDRFRYSVGYTAEFGFSTHTDDAAGTYSEVETVVSTDPLTPTEITTTSATLESRTSTTKGRTIGHTLELGAQFYLTDKIRVNMGTSAQASTLNRTITTVDAGGDSTYTVTEQTGAEAPRTTIDDFNLDLSAGASDGRTVTNGVASGTSIVYDLGFTYIFSDDMELDLAYEGTGGTAAVTTNIWEAGLWSAMMTIRY